MTMRRGSASVSALVLAAWAASCSDARIALLEPRESVSTPDGGSGGGGGAQPGEAGEPAPDIEALRRSACERAVSTGEREQALLMMVIDLSNSMAAPFGPSGSRWDAMRPVLGEAITAMPANAALGALFYPNMIPPPSTQPRSVSACVNTQAIIPVNLLGATDSRQRTRLQRAFAQVLPQGGTPTLDAYFVGLSALGSSTLAGSRQMLLITDGQPTFQENCVGTGDASGAVDPGPIVGTVDAARRAGVRTYVIGAPGSDGPSFNGGDSRSWLSMAAEVGGTAREGCSHAGPRYCHFDMVSEPDLASGLRGALAEIEERMMLCEFWFDDPDQLSQYALNMVLTTEDGRQTLLPTASSEECTHGWHYGNDKTTVSLCKETCATFRSQNQARLEFLFFGGCAQSGRN